MNEAGSASFDTVARYLRDSGLFKPNDLIGQRVLLALYRLVADGAPVAVKQLAAGTGLGETAVTNALADVPPSNYQYDDAGNIIGFLGLTQTPTRHRFAVAGRRLYTWCAFDVLFLPELLAASAAVASICPVSKAEIRLTVTPEGVDDIEPSDTVMSFVMPGAAQCHEDVRGAFCNFVNFLASREAGAAWRSRNPGAEIISLEEAYALGRIHNETGFGDALAE